MVTNQCLFIDDVLIDKLMATFEKIALTPNLDSNLVLSCSCSTVM
jgi:hypothetical protein